MSDSPPSHFSHLPHGYPSQSALQTALTTEVQSLAPPDMYTYTEIPGEDGFEREFWRQQITDVHHTTQDFKVHQLPLARIKKVMKSDDDVKMISAEAPILFSKGCDMFITEVTLRAWKHAVENKRRTLQRSDIAAAISKSDMFDFLIDIVPREESTRFRTTSKMPMDRDYRELQQPDFVPFGYNIPAGQYELGNTVTMNDMQRAQLALQHHHQQHHHSQRPQQQQQQQQSPQQHLYMAQEAHQSKFDSIRFVKDLNQS